MISNRDHRCQLGRMCALPALALTFALGLACTAQAATSPYPAGATRPSVLPRASEFPRAFSPVHGAAGASAHSASASSSGGAAAPGGSQTPAAKTPAKSTKPKKPVLHGNPARALVAFEAMQKYFYIPGSGLYKGEPFSYLWPFSQSLAATVSVAYIPGIEAPGIEKPVAPVSFGRELQARLVGLNSYLDSDNSGSSEGAFTSTLPAFDGTVAPPAGPGGAKYYDDNDWVGIELARLYKLTHNPAALGSAEAIMAFEMAG